MVSLMGKTGQHPDTTCLDCKFKWHARRGDRCPQCGSTDIARFWVHPDPCPVAPDGRHDWRVGIALTDEYSPAQCKLCGAFDSNMAGRR